MLATDGSDSMILANADIDASFADQPGNWSGYHGGSATPKDIYTPGRITTA